MSRTLYFWFHQQWGHLGDITVIMSVKQKVGITHIMWIFTIVFITGEKKNSTLQLIIHSYPQSTQTCTSPRVTQYTMAKIRLNSYIILKTCANLNLDFKQKQAIFPIISSVYFCNNVQRESVNIAHRQKMNSIV